MTKIEILNKYKKQKHNTYRECDVINAMEKYLESYKKDQALQLQQTGVMQSVLFANWIVQKGYKLNNKPFVKGCDAVWFFDKKSTGSTTSELYKQYISETVA